MFETAVTAAPLTLQDQDSGTNANPAPETRSVPARPSALGGNYVAAFGHLRSGGQHPAAARPTAGCGYTARFDGAHRRNSSPAVDSYPASFGTAGNTLGAVTRERGRYTDANL